MPNSFLVFRYFRFLALVAFDAPGLPKKNSKNSNFFLQKFSIENGKVRYILPACSSNISGKKNLRPKIHDLVDFDNFQVF